MTLRLLLKTALLGLSISTTGLAQNSEEESALSCSQEATLQHAEAIKQATSDYQGTLPTCYDRQINTTRAAMLLCIKNAELDRQNAVELADLRLELTLEQCSEEQQ